MRLKRERGGEEVVAEERESRDGEKGREGNGNDFFQGTWVMDGNGDGLYGKVGETGLTEMLPVQPS